MRVPFSFRKRPVRPPRTYQPEQDVLEQMVAQHAVAEARLIADRQVLKQTLQAADHVMMPIVIRMAPRVRDTSAIEK